MLGGLARRVAFVEKMRAEGAQALVVDSGDLFFDFRASEDSNQVLTKARLIGRAYRRMGATAVNVGDLDLIQGLDFLRKETSQGLPLISTNLLDSSSKNPIFPAYVIKEISGIRIAFFGLLSPEFRPEIGPTIQKIMGAKILVKVPVDTARETVLRLRGQADLIVLLSDLGLYKDQEIAQAVPGIHFILGGHEGRFLMRPNQQGKTYFLQSSAKGMYVGKLQLSLGNLASPIQDKGKVEQLREEIRNLEYHLQALQRDQERRPGKEIDYRIQLMDQRKAKLQEELASSSSESLDKRNLFHWSLMALDMALPEDDEARRWIREAAIDRD